MAEAIWTTGKLIPVYQPVGIRANGERRYRRAPYDLLSWASTAGADEALYINTVGNPIASEPADVVNEAHEYGHEFGYYGLGGVVVEPHVGNGSDDTWQAVQSFGFV